MSCCFVLVWVVVVNGIVSFNLNNTTLPFSKLTPPPTPYLFFLIYQRGFLLLFPHKCNSVPSIAWGTVMSHNKCIRLLLFKEEAPLNIQYRFWSLQHRSYPLGQHTLRKDVAGIHTKDSPCVKKNYIQTDYTEILPQNSPSRPLGNCFS